MKIFVMGVITIYKLKKLSIMIGSICLVISIIMHLKSRLIANTVLHINSNSVHFDQIYAMQFSIISIASILFFFGCCVFFFEYVIFRVEINKK